MTSTEKEMSRVTSLAGSGPAEGYKWERVRIYLAPSQMPKYFLSFTSCFYVKLSQIIFSLCFSLDSIPAYYLFI